MKNYIVALVLIPTLSTLVMPAWADSGNVLLANQVVFTTQANSNGMSAGQRAQDFQNKLNNALVATSDRSGGSVNVVYYNNQPVVTLGGYQVAIISQDDATAANTTPALLAQQWADGIRQALGNSQAVATYIAQLTGASAANAPSGGYPQSGYQQSGSQQSGYQQAGSGYGAPSNYQHGLVVYADTGTTIPVTLETSISTEVSKAGDLIVARIAQDVQLQNGTIPAGTVISGNVTNAKSGRMMDRSGLLTVQFNRLRTPNGQETPISAHLTGKIGKYAQKGQDTVRGEGVKAKVFGIGMRTGIGAGLGAALGTGVGAIAGSAGAGAWSGAAIGGGAGLLTGLVLRKGRNVLIPAGTIMQLQLDAPATLSLAQGSTGSTY